MLISEDLCIPILCYKTTFENYQYCLNIAKSEIPPGAFNKEKVKVSIVSEYYIFMAEASVSKMLRDHHYPWEAAGSGRAGVSCVLCRYVDMLGGAR